MLIIKSKKNLYAYWLWAWLLSIWFMPNLSHANGTIWEDLHVFTVQYCSSIADVVSLEDFDEFASNIYTPFDAYDRNAPNFNKETGKWLCAIKHYQMQQNYLSVISAQQLKVKLTALPLLQLEENLVDASYCVTSPPTNKRRDCSIKFKNEKISSVFRLTQPKNLQIQNEISLRLANIYDEYYSAKESLEKAALLLLKEATLRHEKAKINEMITIQNELFNLFNSITESQFKIDAALDSYKHKIDVENRSLYN